MMAQIRQSVKASLKSDRVTLCFSAPLADESINMRFLPNARSSGVRYQAVPTSPASQKGAMIPSTTGTTPSIMKRYCHPCRDPFAWRLDIWSARSTSSALGGDDSHAEGKQASECTSYGKETVKERKAECALEPWIELGHWRQPALA